MMILKHEGQSSPLNLFDVADSARKETSISKILAYLISRELSAFAGTLEAFQISLSRSTLIQAWESSKISIENPYSRTALGNAEKGGRTDIEIKFNDGVQKYYVIIECKVKSGKATIDQYLQYKPLFEREHNTTCIFVYMTHQSGINIIEAEENITVIDLTWRDLINSLSKHAHTPDQARTELDDFLEYYERSYGTTEQKEILVQDLGDPTEIERFQNCVYRRDKVRGAPLYFAPYITKKGAKNSSIPEGLSQISKILGIITIDSGKMEWVNIEASCAKFVSHFSEEKGKNLLKKWGKAIKLGEDKIVPEQLTHYFLDEPTTISPPLQKDSSKGEGRGQGWIAAMIPKNRTITFSTLLEQMNKQRDE